MRPERALGTSRRYTCPNSLIRSGASDPERTCDTHNAAQHALASFEAGEDAKIGQLNTLVALKSKSAFGQNPSRHKVSSYVTRIRNYGVVDLQL